MYSPKIREDLVRRLYREAKRRHCRMTGHVNFCLETMLKDLEQELLPEVHRRPRKPPIGRKWVKVPAYNGSQCA